MITRRGLLQGIIAAAAAPAIVKVEILMPVRKIIRPDHVFSFWCDPTVSIEEYVRANNKAWDDAVRTGQGAMLAFIDPGAGDRSSVIVAQHIARFGATHLRLL